MQTPAVRDDQALSPAEWGELAAAVARWPGHWVIVLDCETEGVLGKVVKPGRRAQRVSLTIQEAIRWVSRSASSDGGSKRHRTFASALKRGIVHLPRVAVTVRDSVRATKAIHAVCRRPIIATSIATRAA